MSAKNYVKHPTISRKEFNGKLLAWCRGGTPFAYILSVDEPPLEDGKFVLSVSRTVLSSPPTTISHSGFVTNFTFGGQGTFETVSLEQSIVDKIVAVEADCPLNLMRFEFAFIEDPQSAFLLKTK